MQKLDPMTKEHSVIQLQRLMNDALDSVSALGRQQDDEWNALIEAILLDLHQLKGRHVRALAALVNTGIRREEA